MESFPDLLLSQWTLLIHLNSCHSIIFLLRYIWMLSPLFFCKSLKSQIILSLWWEPILSPSCWQPSPSWLLASSTWSWLSSSLACRLSVQACSQSVPESEQLSDRQSESLSLPFGRSCNWDILKLTMCNFEVTRCWTALKTAEIYRLILLLLFFAKLEIIWDKLSKKELPLHKSNCNAKF